jgi:hypothetical protein
MVIEKRYMQVLIAGEMVISENRIMKTVDSVGLLRICGEKERNMQRDLYVMVLVVLC